MNLEISLEIRSEMVNRMDFLFCFHFLLNCCHREICGFYRFFLLVLYFLYRFKSTFHPFVTFFCVFTCFILHVFFCPAIFFVSFSLSAIHNVDALTCYLFCLVYLITVHTFLSRFFFRQTFSVTFSFSLFLSNVGIAVKTCRFILISAILISEFNSFMVHRLKFCWFFVFASSKYVLGWFFRLVCILNI